MLHTANHTNAYSNSHSNLQILQCSNPFTAASHEGTVDLKVKDFPPTGVVGEDTLRIDLLFVERADWSLPFQDRIKALTAEEVTTLRLNRILHCIQAHWAFMPF